MLDENAVIIDGDLVIPADALTWDGFQRWCFSEEFPETGRIDYLDGTIYLELNELGEGAEDLFTHNAVRVAIGSRLHLLLNDLGEVFHRGVRVVSSGVSFAPDLAVVLLESLEKGRARWMEAPIGSPDRFQGIQGAPDLVVEILSDTSETRDKELLPDLYAQAGVPEMWLVDGRDEALRFEIRTLHKGRYKIVKPDADGWIHSPRLAHSFRLVRWRREGLGTWRYTLEVNSRP